MKYVTSLCSKIKEGQKG